MMADFGAAMAKKLVGRQDDDGIPPGYVPIDDQGTYMYFWDTRQGIIIKWCVFLGLVLFITLWMVLGRQHALRRMRAGRKPIFGTGWLLSRQERGRVDPRYANPWPGQVVYAQYQPGPPGQAPGGGWYNMNNMPPPPPVYDANRPPMYPGADPAAAPGSKVDPDQTREPASGRQDDYAPPAGPPPGR